MDRVTKYFESSFLAPLLKNVRINDISYNGEDIFYEDKTQGRKKSSIKVSKNEVSDFLRQIANLTEKQFSYQSPNLDVTFSNYRLNAMYTNVVKVNEDKSYSFSIRIASASNELDSDFFEGDSEAIISEALNSKESIVISGPTSSGKTQLQKYLISKLKENSKVIVIDNVRELELIRANSAIDLTTWQADETIKSISFESLIKNALRNNPDYIVVAEARGGEMLQVLNSVMSGHPIIMTMHSKDLLSIPQRMARMTMMNDEKELYEDALSDIYHHFSLVVYLKKETLEDGTIKRYVDSIGRLEEKDRSVKLLYRRINE